jgi:hypothetical protein
MPEPWDQKRIAELTEMMLELLDAADLDDDQADTVCKIFIEKLWQRSGLDLPAFDAAARVAIPDLEWSPIAQRRH